MSKIVSRTIIASAALLGAALVAAAGQDGWYLFLLIAMVAL